MAERRKGQRIVYVVVGIGGTIITSAILFAAKFAYDSNANLAVLNLKIDQGLTAIKECRTIVDVHDRDIAVIQERLRKGNL